MSSPYPCYYTDYAITDIAFKSVLLTGGDRKPYIYKFHIFRNCTLITHS